MEIAKKQEQTLPLNQNSRQKYKVTDLPLLMKEF
jgi:hypothetical protein